MNFFEAVSTCFRKYATFSGRARRSEFWFFSLFCSVASVVIELILGALPVFSLVFSLATLLPALAVSWRRMHDIGKAGAWSLLAFVPIVGFIIVLIWNCRDSQPGDNIYGPNPKIAKSTLA